MKKFSKIFNKISEGLDGKKTYLIMACTIVFALSGYISGNLGSKEAVELILGALGIGSLRSAVKKLE